jgi:hypothetical protein
MKTWLVALALGVTAAPAAGQGQAGGQQYRDAVTAAARELNREIDLFQQAFLQDPSPPEQNRGLFKQSEGVRLSLIVFKQQLGRGVSRDDLYVALDEVEGKLKALLEEVGPMEKWNPAIKLAARRLQAAGHDLQFAVTAGDAAPARVGAAVYRQTLALTARAEDLQRAVKWVFKERPPLKAWTDDVTALRQALTTFQKLQQDKAPLADLKAQFARVLKVWDGVHARWDLSTDKLLLQPAVAAVDRSAAQLATALGVKDRRPPLRPGIFD